MAQSILVVGSINHDSVYKVAHLPRAHETVPATSFVTAPGGKGANQAVASARATGGLVQMLACIGEDMHGAYCLSYLRENGVDVSPVLKLDHLPTGTACILVEESGHNLIVVAAGANGGLQAAHVESAGALIDACAFVLVQLEVPLATVKASLHMARIAGRTTILNPAPYVAGVEAFAALCDVVTPNQTEASSLTGIDVHDISGAKRAAKAILEMGAANAIITLGEHGSLVATQTDTRHVPAYKVSHVVDTSGAGDVYNGALVGALADGASLIEAADFASAAAALSVQKPTASHCAPRREDVHALMERG